MKIFRSFFTALFLLLPLIGKLSGAEETEQTEKTKPAARWNFELLPRAFQKNPNLDITVISELSAAGKQRPVPTSEAPVYYLLHAGGYKPRGEAVSQEQFPAEKVEAILERALTASNYLPAPPGVQPAIVVVYMWGPHNIVDPENALSPDRVIRNILDRAALAGGEKFATELERAIKASNDMAEASAPALAPVGDGASFGAAAAFGAMAALADPVKRFRARSSKNDFLLTQASSNCYYLVASAYDYQSLGTPQRLLLWRTRMTVSADGVSQLEAIPVMISSSAPYIGRDMPETAIITKPALLKGEVKMGTPIIIDSLPTKPAEKTKK